MGSFLLCRGADLVGGEGAGEEAEAGQAAGEELGAGVVGVAGEGEILGGRGDAFGDLGGRVGLAVDVEGELGALLDCGDVGPLADLDGPAVGAEELPRLDAGVELALVDDEPKRVVHTLAPGAEDLAIFHSRANSR